jgi:hypothetical protein
VFHESPDKPALQLAIGATFSQTDKSTQRFSDWTAFHNAHRAAIDVAHFAPDQPANWISDSTADKQTIEAAFQ